MPKPNPMDNSLSLMDVFTELKLHPLVGIKAFVYKPAIDDTRYELIVIPFYGYGIKIFRLGKSYKTWRISPTMADAIRLLYKRMHPTVKQFLLDTSTEFYKLGQQSKSDKTVQENRTLLGMNLFTTLPFKAKLSDYRKIVHDGTKRLKICLVDLRNPETGEVYADHTHVLVPKFSELKFGQIPIGSELEFTATVRQYNGSSDTKKYGIWGLDDVVLC